MLSCARLIGGCLWAAWVISAGGCGGSASSPGSAPSSGGTGATGPSGGNGNSTGGGGSGSTSGSGSSGSGSGGSSLPGTGGSASKGSGGSADLSGSGGSSSGASSGGGAVGGSVGAGGSSSQSGTGGVLAGSGGSAATATGGFFGSGGTSASAGGAGGSFSTGGTTGTSPGGGRSGTSPPGQCPANAIFCADFESGTIPSQANFFPEYLRATLSTYLTVDATTGYNSAHSARFAGTSFSQMLGVSTGTSTFWTRVYLRSDVDINTNTGHATYVAATDGNGDPNMGEQIRVGEHECQLEVNRRSDDKEMLSNGGTYQCSGGTVFSKNTWYCLETFYDGPGAEVRVFVNGSETAALHVTGWGPYGYDMFKFGFENYSSQPRTMWYDEIAIAPQQIGCH